MQIRPLQMRIKELEAELAEANRRLERWRPGAEPVFWAHLPGVLGLNCPLCGCVSTVEMPFTNRFGREWFRCQTCFLYFTLPPGETFLRDFYQHKYWKLMGGSRNLLKKAGSRLRAMNQYRLFRWWFPPDYFCRFRPSMLDVGCGDGALVKTFASHRWFARGVEAGDEITVHPMRPRYDLVILSHTLEHLPDPGEILARIRNILHPGHGKLFVEVPESPLRGAVNERRLADYLNTTHIYNYRKTNLRMQLETAGYEVERMWNIWWPSIGTCIRTIARRGE